MGLNRFYCPSIKDAAVELAGAEAHHLLNVLRLGKGDKVELFDGAGKLAEAVITHSAKQTVTLRTEKIQSVPRPFERQIIIASSIAKAERFNWLISKCTELGVDRIVPVLFDRTVKLAANPKITQRWHNIAVAAAKQCLRLYLPRIDKPMPLREAIVKLTKEHPQGRIFFGDFSKEAIEFLNQPVDETDVIAFVGPEGGLTDDEKKILRKYGAKAARLSNTVLRIETAAVGFAVLLSNQRLAGNLRDSTR